jgi:hypothetical protein
MVAGAARRRPDRPGPSPEIGEDGTALMLLVMRGSRTAVLHTVVSAAHEGAGMSR